MDFCLTEDNEPRRLIEVKPTDDKPGRGLINFSRRYDIPAIQVVLHFEAGAQKAGY